MPPRSENVQHVYHQFVDSPAERDALRAHLQALQIDTAVLYPVPIHQQPAYRGRIAVSGDLSVTERAARELLCLPMHPTLDDDDVERVASAIRAFLPWLRQSHAAAQMSVAELDTMRSVEDDLWWYRGLRRHVVESIAATASGRSSCSMPAAEPAACWRTCARAFPQAALTGLDFGERALELTRRTRDLGAELVQGSTDQLPFGDAEFDVVLSLDVIVLHGIDDQKAIARNAPRPAAGRPARS